MTRGRSTLLAVLVGLAALAVYLRTLYPGLVGSGDTPELQFVGRVLGTAHTPGYPLYVVVSHLFSRLPLGNLAWRINLMSALFGAGAAALAYGETSLDAPTKADLTQTIYDEANRLDRLVHNLQEMSRLQSGQTKLNCEWHVMEEVVGCALAQLEPQLQNHPVVIQLPPDLPMVRIDALLMERVFINLLENAIKYTSDQTPVMISGWVTQQELLLEVADRGPGLVPGDEELVFEKFYQAGSGSARGVGLGLTICRSIIEAHKGHIWAANRPGGGATFRFTLPLEEGAPLLDKTLPDTQLQSKDLEDSCHSELLNKCTRVRL